MKKIYKSFKKEFDYRISYWNIKCATMRFATQ